VGVELASVVAAVGLLAFCGAYALLGGELHHFMRAGPPKALRSIDAWIRAREQRRGLSQKARRQRVLYSMPTFLDILTLGLTAGLSFDASVELYCKRYDSELSDLLWNAMLSWRMGTCSRAQALRSMANELEAPTIERFAATVEEALAFGTPLSSVLERQAQLIRDEQKAQVEEEIERIPVKMLIPLGTLIVPAMLLAILGPLLGPALAST